MLTVQKVSKLTGVSVRTLHYYDQIGLLSPSALTESGYRLYDDAALERLQNILFFRELEFPLKEIKAMLDNPKFDSMEALAQQEKLLRMKRERLDKLIAFILAIRSKGEMIMDFEKFDRSEQEQYEKEVKARWGGSEAYGEYEKKARNRSQADWEEGSAAMKKIFDGFRNLSAKAPEDREVQSQVRALQETITRYYYTCTNEILASLGQMYTDDPRFQANIDQDEPGTAAFVRRAIEVYCKK